MIDFYVRLKRLDVEKNEKKNDVLNHFLKKSIGLECTFVDIGISFYLKCWQR